MTTRVALAVVALVAVGSILVAVTSNRASSAGVALGVVAPHPAAPFRLSPVLGTTPVSLALAPGTPVMLSFFASWCTGCQQELHTMQSVLHMAGSRVRVIGVDVNDGRSAVKALLAADHLSYPVGFDGSGTVSSSYQLVGLPTTVFLDAGHRVVGQVLGPLGPATAGQWFRRLGGH